jgi:hypothetical protein
MKSRSDVSLLSRSYNTINGLYFSSEKRPRFRRVKYTRKILHFCRVIRVKNCSPFT